MVAVVQSFWDAIKRLIFLQADVGISPCGTAAAGPNGFMFLLLKPTTLSFVYERKHCLFSAFLTAMRMVT